jgi:hypothetical protein
LRLDLIGQGVAPRGQSGVAWVLLLPVIEGRLRILELIGGGGVTGIQRGLSVFGDLRAHSLRNALEVL